MLLKFLSLRGSRCAVCLVIQSSLREVPITSQLIAVSKVSAMNSALIAVCVCVSVCACVHVRECVYL